MLCSRKCLLSLVVAVLFFCDSNKTSYSLEQDSLVVEVPAADRSYPTEQNLERTKERAERVAESQRNLRISLAIQREAKALEIHSQRIEECSKVLYRIRHDVPLMGNLYSRLACYVEAARTNKNQASALDTANLFEDIGVEFWVRAFNVGYKVYYESINARGVNPDINQIKFSAEVSELVFQKVLERLYPQLADKVLADNVGIGNRKKDDWSTASTQDLKLEAVKTAAVIGDQLAKLAELERLLSVKR